MKIMFPIDPIILISVLILVTVTLYILILKKLAPKSISSEITPKQDSKVNDAKQTENLSENPSEAIQSKQTTFECSHHFGYLRTVPKNTPLPDECLGCPRIVKCLTPPSTKKSPGKQK